MGTDISKNEGLTFKGVVLSFLYRLSEITAASEPSDYLIDSLWAMLKPFTIEEDNEAWQSHTGDNSYQSTMNKLRILSLVLYRNGLLPAREYIGNRKFEISIKKSKQGNQGLKSHVIEDIQINQFFMRHLLLISIIAKRYADYGCHIDTLWSMLSPYVTEEDYNEWESNNKTYGNHDSWMYHPYIWSINKIRICVTCMDRADFLWRTGTVDEPEEMLSKAGVPYIRSRGSE
jgi:hypothetical protein